MKLVVDANALFGFFKKSSKTRELILDPELKYNLKLVAPQLVLKEVGEHKNDICSQFNLNPKDFDEMFFSLKLFINVAKKADFENFISEAKKILPDHLKDVPYLALALWLKHSGIDIGLWTNENRLKILEKQSIKVYTTKQLLEYFGLI